MRTIRLDGKIVDFVRRVKDIKRFGGDGTINKVVAEALRLFIAKHDRCFACPFHKSQIADIELGRQKMAKDCKEPKKPKWAWVVCDVALLAEAQRVATAGNTTARNVVEQALLEHITRPPECGECPFYKEMCQGSKECEVTA